MEFDLSKKKLFYLSLVFYSSNIINIFLTMEYLKAKEIAYFIIFWTLFSLDKLISLYIIGCNHSLRTYVFWLLDVLQLGSIYILFSNYTPFGADGLVTTKLFARVFPLILSETVIFFGLGIMQQTQVGDYLAILTYINYFIFLLLAIVLLTIFDRKGTKTLCENFINIIASYIVQASLLQLDGPLGVKVGYYTFGLQAIVLLVIILIVPTRIRKQQDNLLVFSLSSLNQISLKNSLNIFTSSIEIKICDLQYYFNQYVRYILLVVYGVRWLLSDYNFSSVGDKIYFINLIIGLAFGFVQFFMSLKNLFYQLFSVRSIVTEPNNIKHFKKTIKKIPTRKGVIQKLTVIFEKNPNHYSLLDEYGYNKLIDKDQCSSECQLSLDFFVKMQNLQQHQISITYLDQQHSPNLCDSHFIELCTLVYNIPDILMYRVEQILPYSRPDSSLDLAHDILLKRFSNGLYCLNIQSTFHQDLMKRLQYLNRVLQIPSLENFDQLKASSMQIFLFCKQISEFMTILPTQILYDLYETSG